MDFEEPSLEQLEYIIKIINQCTDAFVFMYDVNADTYIISRNALRIFDFPGEKFSHAMEAIQKITLPDDRTTFSSDIELIRIGKKADHNLEIRLFNKLGKPVWISSRGKLTPTANPYAKIVIGTIEITNDFDKSDILTGLSTESQLRSDFALTKTSSDLVSGFMLKIDIDQLSSINEQFGVRVGDLVISRVGECCKKVCTSLTKAYKVNSDEFICMDLTGMSALVAKRLYDDIKRELARAESTDGLGHEVAFTISGGILAFSDDSSHLEEFMRKLNYTLQIAQSRGGNTVSTYNANEYANHLRVLNLQEKLRDSIKNNFAGFELFYQPVVDAKRLYLDSDNTVLNVIGAEALLRWSHKDYGMLHPDDFIPILERTGMIVSVGRWILKTAFSQCREWNRIQKDFKISVNISYVQVQRSDILSDIETAKITSGVNPNNITLELTESGYIDNSQALQELTEAFATRGFNVDIDDFGTGYSNLRYLQYLHASTLKLDYTFVHKATHGNDGDSKVIKHITQMAHELNMKVCMEGVESKDELAKLQDYAPDKFQGFFFGRPMTATHFREHHLRPDITRDVFDKNRPQEELGELPSAESV